MSTVRRGRAQLTVATLVAAAPYLSVKIAWLAGWPLGQRDPAVLAATPYPQANAATLLLDVAVVLTVRLLTTPGPGRVPPAAVALIGWLGGGLLAPVVLGVVVLSPAAWEVGAGRGSDPLYGWVYLVVYVSLAGQAVLLQIALVGYLRRRTARLWSAIGDPGSPAVGPSGWVAIAAAVVAVGAGAGGLALAAGLGAPPGADSLWRATTAMHAVIAALTASTIVHLVRTRWRLGYASVGVIWFGTAAITAWGGYDTIISLWQGAPATVVVWSLLRCGGGLILAAAALLALKLAPYRLAAAHL